VNTEQCVKVAAANAVLMVIKRKFMHKN